MLEAIWKVQDTGANYWVALICLAK